MKRTYLALLGVLLLLAGCLTGCAKKEDTPSVYYLNFKPEQGDDWQALAKAYTEKTGVPVKVTTAASNTYESTLQSEIAKSDAPTLFQVNGPVGLATWKNRCYDLRGSAIYEHLKNDEFALRDGDQVLGIAYVIETYGILYNKAILRDYCALDGAVIEDASQITNFATLKAVADDMQARKEELGIDGAFTSAGMDSSSDWRFKTHLANLPLYYEYRDRGITAAQTVEGTYLDQFKQIFDLYLTDSTCAPALLSGKTGADAASEFALGRAAFYQNGTWAYGDITGEGSTLSEDDIGLLPIYIGVSGEEEQGLCTGSENYWCVNKNASQADIQATLDFLEWCITSDEGRTALGKTMNFVTPFDTFTEEYLPQNPLIQAANDALAQGKTPVAWVFSTMPSETWRNNLGSALLEYAQGTGDWDAVERSFVEGWETEYNATHG